MTKDQEFIVWLRQTFHVGRKVIECLHKSTDVETMVCETDGEETVTVFRKEAPAGLQINNPSQKEIHLFSLDHCFFSSTDSRHCDCMVFDDHCCCFVEFKLNIKKWNNYNDNAKDAIKQLGKTILFFNSSSNDTPQVFSGFVREAYIVTRDHIYPRNQASRETRRINFLQNYSVALYETNIKEF